MTYSEKDPVGEFLHRIGAEKAYREDPRFHWQVQWLRRVMVMVDDTLRFEGVDEKTRERVARVLTYGTPDADRAEERLAAHERLLEQMSMSVQSPVFGQELFLRAN